ncbi:MAG: ribosome silencing factor [Sandaracinaceae bacterium]
MTSTKAEWVTTERRRESPAASARAAEHAAARDLALAVAGVAVDRKALKVEIIDVEGKVDYADFIVVMSGRSDRQVAALAKNVEGDVKTRTGQRCLSLEGLPKATWVLMDFGDVIVHIFHEDMRGYYDLEGLWIDAPRVPVPLD